MICVTLLVLNLTTLCLLFPNIVVVVVVVFVVVVFDVPFTESF